jgi:hypothetical protein
MTATAIHRLTLDPLGKGGHLGFPIGIKNIQFVEDLPMIIPGQFGFNSSRGSEEDFQRFPIFHPIRSHGSHL